jgi:hypothetical protein
MAQAYVVGAVRQAVSAPSARSAIDSIDGMT